MMRTSARGVAAVRTRRRRRSRARRSTSCRGARARRSSLHRRSGAGGQPPHVCSACNSPSIMKVPSVLLPRRSSTHDQHRFRSKHGLAASRRNPPCGASSGGHLERRPAQRVAVFECHPGHSSRSRNEVVVNVDYALIARYAETMPDGTVSITGGGATILWAIPFTQPAVYEPNAPRLSVATPI